MLLFHAIWLGMFVLLMVLWAWRVRGYKKFEANNYWSVLCYLKQVGRPKELRHLAEDLECDMGYLKHLLSRQAEEGYVWPALRAVHGDESTRTYQISLEGELLLQENADMLKQHQLNPGV